MIYLPQQPEVARGLKTVFVRSFFRNEQGDDPPPAHVAAKLLPAKPEPCAADRRLACSTPNTSRNKKSTALNAWFWVDEATFRWIARYDKNDRIESVSTKSKPRSETYLI